MKKVIVLLVMLIGVGILAKVDSEWRSQVICSSCGAVPVSVSYTKSRKVNGDTQWFWMCYRCSVQGWASEKTGWVVE